MNVSNAAASSHASNAAASADADLAGLALPSGVTLRRWRGMDVDMPEIWRVSDRSRVADGEHERNSVDGMTAYYRHLEHCDLDRDLVIAESDGQVIGYARVEWSDTNDGERWYEGVCNIDPAHRRRGLGTALQAWTERRRLAIAAAHTAAGEATDRPRALTSFVFDGDRGGAILLEQTGHVPMRHFATMRRPDLDAIPDVPLPEGLEIRPIARDRDAMRPVFDADVEAFREHFGWTEGTDERFAAFVEDPTVDPDLWVVAFDGAEIAGAILNGIHVSPEGDRSGWLDSVFTRRPWRKRGLARALIVRSLALLRDRGLTAASLGVDTANANQALGLYESCGFRIVSSSTAYRKPLPTPAAAREPTREPTHEELP